MLCRQLKYRLHQRALIYGWHESERTREGMLTVFFYKWDNFSLDVKHKCDFITFSYWDLSHGWSLYIMYFYVLRYKIENELWKQNETRKKDYYHGTPSPTARYPNVVCSFQLTIACVSFLRPN